MKRKIHIMENVIVYFESLSYPGVSPKISRGVIEIPNIDTRRDKKNEGNRYRYRYIFGNCTLSFIIE
ncbi:MAG: hypothetical protein EZS28_028957 [Streblomastix strix]|uniref:Uncharacterized protein n=1 Tax=Streblomastix strix TaxID=222440 RepID=A0A5J4V0F3_9EUKA|nr:MAG: hypothetical protein EZS28_028957 [Streblomastix strix]